MKKYNLKKKEMGCKASAFGYVPKGKNSTRHIIKDITSTMYNREDEHDIS